MDLISSILFQYIYFKQQLRILSCNSLHCLKQYIMLFLYKVCESCSVVSDSFWPHGLCSPWNSPGQNTGVSSHSLLEGIFPTQGSNLGLLHCRHILYPLSHQGSSRIQKWVVYPFSSGSYQPRNRTRVSCVTGGFFTKWVIREAPNIGYIP